MTEIIPLENSIMEYAWGSRIHIPALLGAATPSMTPQAELWMGAHPKAPSRVADRTLLEIIEEDPVGMLGPDTAKRFQGQLPFLFKLLAAETPLSIQAHPNREQAKLGYAAEEADGLAPDAANRNYKDDNHKPEILCALTDFWALNGFRELPPMIELLDEARLDTIRDELESLRQTPNKAELRRFFGSIIEIDELKKDLLLKELLESAQELQSTRPEYRWILEIADLFPGDVGVLCVLLLNLVKLKPGQAMFCAAGDLHAYLRGFAIELMANSDNVLRGGLTSKHVDVPELMKTLTFECRGVDIVVPRGGRYYTTAEEFVLSVLRVYNHEIRHASPGFEILVNVDGNATVSDSAGTCTCVRFSGQ